MKTYFLAIVIALGLFGTAGYWWNLDVHGEYIIKMLEHGTDA
ncbi:hypothetical protein P4H70_07810 [Paenibacillus ehimensis]|nr:hypothetical protein [Paenibacillus ehimensis]MEC0208852.1 hypothetical protein [Paenibacillus ehimensis]